MSIRIEITDSKQAQVKYLQVDAQVRYWDDAIINGQSDDEAGSLTPCRADHVWRPLIDIEAGKILDWPDGTLADVHFKVCDAGVYTLLDEARKEVIKREGYVPDILCPGGNGYGDYIIMTINERGEIANWRIDLDDFIQSGD